MDDEKLTTEFITDLAALNDLLVDETKILHDFNILNETVLMVTWKYKEDLAVGGKKSNIFIAAFTTCWARLKLYEEIEKLGDRVHYFDTDSLILRWKPGQYEPKLSDYLGSYTDELQCKNVGCSGCSQQHYICEFIAAGPKNYAYKVDTGHTVCKVRGFTLKGVNAESINFDTMKELVMAPRDADLSYVIREPSKITRHKTQSIIFNRPATKTYRMTYDKRVLLSDYDTVPYGF